MKTEAVARISKRLNNDLRIVGYSHDRYSSVTSYNKKKNGISQNLSIAIFLYNVWLRIKKKLKHNMEIKMKCLHI